MIGKGSFGPTPVVSASGHARSFEDTWAWIAPKLPLVPISRVYDATPLDFLGLPVWSAVTPLARDLTVHAGKGRSPLAAKISAVMEAVERVCGEDVPDDHLIRGSFEDLTRRDLTPVDPECFDLPFGTAYHPAREFSWVAAYDLMNDEHVHVPADLVVSPAREGVCQGVETNGLASGNTLTEAVLHALYEVIERDALAHEQFFLLHHDTEQSARNPVRTIDPATLPDDSRAWVERLDEQGLAVRIRDITGRNGVPVFGATLVDRSFPGMEEDDATFGGYGCDLDPARAVLRSITEAVQSHTGVMVGARDEFEGARPFPDRAAMLLRRLDFIYPPSVTAFPRADRASQDLLPDLREVVDRLRAAGHPRCLVGDLTRPDLGVPVVRVLVPGLSAPYGDSSRAPSASLLKSVI